MSSGRVATSAAAVLLCTSSLWGCSATVPEGVLACEQAEECPGGWVCGDDDRCYSSQARADEAASGGEGGSGGGRSDGGTADGGGSGNRDGGPGDGADGGGGNDGTDAGGSDRDDAGASIDAGGGPTDGGSQDAAGVDAGVDAGPGSLDIADTISTLVRHGCFAISFCESRTGALLTEALALLTCHPAAGAEEVAERFALAVEEGRIGFDRTAAEGCLAGLPAPRCAREGAPPPPACDAMFSGLVEEGGACNLDEECVGDLACLGLSDACGGVCATVGGPGDSCIADEECRGDILCLKGQCTDRVGPGDGCIDDAQCPEAHICDPTDTCVPLPMLSQPCIVVLGQSLCGPNLVCVGWTQDVEGSCGMGVDAGARCDDTSPCRVGHRCVSPDDVSDSVCVPIARPGGPCTGNDCPYGMFCAADDTCHPLPVVGESCMAACPGLSGRCPRCAEGVCQNGACEFLDSGFCVESSLSPFRTCRGYCDAGSCAPLVGEGDACVPGACQDGLVCGDSVAPTCERIECGLTP